MERTALIRSATVRTVSAVFLDTATIVDATTGVVNGLVHETEDSRSHSGVDHWKTLADRIEWVLSEKRIEGMRAWSRGAGLTETHLQGIIKRSRKAGEKGGEARPAFTTIQKLASAARVNSIWLMAGKGSPDDPEDPSSDETAIHIAQIDAAVALAVRTGVSREYALAYRKDRPKELEGAPLLMDLIGSYMSQSRPSGPSNDDAIAASQMTKTERNGHAGDTNRSGGVRSAIDEGRQLLDRATGNPPAPAKKAIARKK